MANYADEKLRKVTLNLYDKDVEFFQRVYGQGYSEEIRRAVRKVVREKQRDFGEGNQDAQE